MTENKEQKDRLQKVLKLEAETFSLLLECNVLPKFLDNLLCLGGSF